jgi:hypothetical protein
MVSFPFNSFSFQLIFHIYILCYYCTSNKLARAGVCLSLRVADTVTPHVRSTFFLPTPSPDLPFQICRRRIHLPISPFLTRSAFGLYKQGCRTPPPPSRPLEAAVTLRSIATASGSPISSPPSASPSRTPPSVPHQGCFCSW